MKAGDEIGARLRTTFLGELEEQVRAMNAELLSLEREPRDAERLKALFRVAHTVKGAARAAGVPLVEQTCHVLESMLSQARDGKLQLGAEHFATLFAAADALADAGQRLRAHRDLSDSPLASLHSSLVTKVTRGVKAVPPVPPVPAASRQSDELVRVRSDRLDELLASAQQLMVARDDRAREGAVDDVLRRVRELRMRPLADACEALPRTVRDLAAASNKAVQLVVMGGDVEADRAVLDGIREALLHIVRNAVDHGIESPNERVRMGKARDGRITVAGALRESRMTVTVTDDGAGVDVATIRSRMADAGMPVPEDDREVARRLLQGGLSTQTRATAISGRGVGLDAARAALERVRGNVNITWETGRGTTLTLQCPPSLTSLRAVLAGVASHTVAMPTMQVIRLLRVKPADIRRVEGREVLAADGEVPVPLVSLARILPPLAAKPVVGAVPVVVLSTHDKGRRLAVAVDELVGEEEVVLQPLDNGRRRVPLLSGAALLRSGRVALVLDVDAIVSAGLGVDTTSIAFEDARPAGKPTPRILVVDDSITTRTLEQSVLEAAGYDVVTAADGMDAWRVLQERGANLVVADVEMPRMDGFALTEAIRSSTRFKQLPVVLLTALEAPEHRARGLEVGADAYIGKSSFDQGALLATIQQLLGHEEG